MRDFGFSMTCLYGTEPKFSGDSTIVIRPFEEFPLAWHPAMIVAIIPNQYDFSTDEICSESALPYREIEITDFLVINVLLFKEKIEHNSKRLAWLKGCQCKPKPPEMPPPTEEEPDPAPDPLDPPPIPPEPNCSTPSYGSGNWLIWRLVSKTNGTSEWYRVAVTKPLISIRRETRYRLESSVFAPYVPLDELPENPSDEPLLTLELLYYVEGDDDEKLADQSTVSVIRNAKPLTCAGFPDPTEPEPDPEPLDPCKLFDCGEGCGDCLKQPDKAEIISILQLYISESNNRIRDEIIDSLSAKTSLDKGDIAGYIESSKLGINENIDFTRGVVISRYEALKTQIENLDQGLKDWIDGAKNQTLAGIATSTAAIAAAIAAGTTVVTTAVTASTATITTAIAAAKTAITVAIEEAQVAIEGKIKEESEKTRKEVKEDIEDYTPRNRFLDITITRHPTNESYTVGLNGSPDRYAFGWVVWVYNDGGSDIHSERQFITFKKQRFVCPWTNIEADAKIHVRNGITYTLTNDISPIKLEED